MSAFSDFASKAGRWGLGIGTVGGSELANQFVGGKIFGGGPDNPADSAMPYLEKIPGTLHGIYDPYIQHGNDQYGDLSKSYNEMSNDPSAYLESLMANYTPSKGYELKRDEGLRAAGNTAAAGGMRGSIGDIQNQSRLVNSLLGSDMQQWLQNVMGVKGTGLAGKQGLYDTGYNASQNLGSDISNTLGTQSQLAFQGKANENQQKADLMNNIYKLVGLGGSAFLMGATGMPGLGGAGMSDNAAAPLMAPSRLGLGMPGQQQQPGLGYRYF